MKVGLSSKRLLSSFARLLQRMDKEMAPPQVHKLRTTARRIEALAGHLPDKFREKNSQILDEIHTVRKKSGKVRDLDVQMDLLLKVGTGARRLQYDALEQHLQEQRSRRAAKVFKEVRLLQRKKWQNRLDDLRAEIADQTLDENEKNDPLPAAREQLTVIAARYPDASSMVDPEELHRLRIDLKKVRYTAELAGKGPEVIRFTSAIEDTQDAIGRWHDWLTLAETAEEVLNNYVSSGFLIQLRSLTTSAFSEAVRSAGDLLATVSAPARKSPRSAGTRSRVPRSA